MFDEILLGAEGSFASHLPVFCESQGNDAGDKGGSHRGAAESGVTARRIAGGDLIAWSHDINLSATRRELREFFSAVDRANRHHLGEPSGIAYGVQGGAFVASGGDHEDALGDGVKQGLVNFFVRFRAAQTHREDVGSGFNGPVDTCDDVTARATSLVIENFGCDDFRPGGDADDAVCVAAGGDDARDMGAVTLGVVGSGRATSEISGFEDGGLEIGMFKGDACIQDAHLDTFALGFFPEGWDSEEFEAPVDCLGCGQHDLIDLKGREAVDGGGHRRFHMRSGSELKL